MKRYFNKEALLEGLCCLFFAFSLFRQIITGNYLLFVTPRMKFYLYFSAAVMVLWAFSCFRRLAVPQYKIKLNRFFVVLLPAAALFLPYTSINASDTAILAPAVQTQGTLPAEPGSSAAGTPRKTSGAESAAGEKEQSADKRQETAQSITENQSEVASPSGTAETTASDPHEIAVPDGLDSTNKTITISDDNFYAWMVQLNYYPDKYDGYTLRVHGTVYRDDSMDPDEFAVIRLLMTCCVADLTTCGPLCIYSDAENLTPDSWVTVTGTYHYDTYEGMKVTVTDIEEAEAAEEAYIYPVF